MAEVEAGLEAVSLGKPERGPLVGRHRELALLDEELGRSGSAVVTGAVGVGKSALMAAALGRLRAAGRPTVVVRATRSTASIPFGAFARWVPERLASTRDWLGVLQGTAAELVGVGPGLVVVVDDAQLLDEGSAALVLHLAQHTRSSVLVAVRSGADEPCPDAVVALWKERLAVRVDLQALSEPETAELVGQMLGGGDVAPAARRRIRQLTEGNPMYLQEVVDAARAQGVLVLGEPRSAGPVGSVGPVEHWRWEGTLAGSSRLVELVGRRIAAGGPDERRVLELIALGEPLPVDLLARLAPQELLAGIESRGLLLTERPSSAGEGPAVRLAHPLYSEVVRSGLQPFTARSHQRALADAAIAAGVHRRDPLRVATWMLEGGDEATEPDLLLQAALVAQILDEFDLSARLAAAAERAGAGAWAALLRAESLAADHRVPEAEALLSRLSGPDQAPEVRAAALRVHSDLVFWHHREGLAAARRILGDGAASLPLSARSPVLTQSARMAVAALDLDEAIRLSTAAVAAADSLADRLHGVTCASLALAFQGRTSLALALVAAMTPYAMEVAEVDPVPGSYAAGAYSFASVLDGRIDEAVAVFEVMVDHEIVSMYRHMQGYPTFCLARAVMAQGRVATAADMCREVLDLLGDGNHFGRGTWVAGTLAAAAAQAGDVETAAAAVAWLESYSHVSAEPDGFVVRLGQAWWRASMGELSSARELALEAADQAGKAGGLMFEVLGLVDVVRLGDPAAAAPRLEQLASLVDGPYAQAAACLGRAAAARDGAGLDVASARFAAMGARLLGAEAAALAAAAHGTAGRRRDAAAALTSAQRLAAWCGGAATPLLAGLSQDPPARSLSRREREVAELAARGRTSREIAEALSLSLRTVDSHLDHTYTKLGITNRRDLPAALGLEP